MLEKKLKLAPGRNVPMEDGRDWPKDGAMVPVTHYIRRRLKDGDLIEIGAKAVASAPAVTEPETNTEETASKAKTGGK
ncbi:DUF2635 domain-containing protein [Brucella haematophila]|uniref:DUF2635 domain-containing protein n=1 Tax=Brucella haematophila TaxID=419474 RepID=A0ABX1DMV3_9HYPH|nr:DUF2635 domain-containing protein [Brucella haematophila]NKC04287.1 DUF2635 domain-containing protein [Brucella haematophila]TMV06136.1 DUF2635 domain-containing protein [Brucella haematophila]